jgi:hypothetical protein
MSACGDWRRRTTPSFALNDLDDHFQALRYELGCSLDEVARLLEWIAIHRDRLPAHEVAKVLGELDPAKGALAPTRRLSDLSRRERQ